MSLEFPAGAKLPAAVIAALKFGRTSEHIEVETTARMLREYVVESQRERPDILSIINAPPVMNTWPVKICSEGAYFMAQKAIDLSLEVLPGVPPDALRDLKGE